MTVHLQLPGSTETDRFAALDELLAGPPHETDASRAALSILEEIATAAEVAGHVPVVAAAKRLVELLTLVQCQPHSDDCTGLSHVEEILRFVRAKVSVLGAALADDSALTGELDGILTESDARWNQWLELLRDDAAPGENLWPSPAISEATPPCPEDESVPSADELATFLAASRVVRVEGSGHANSGGTRQAGDETSDSDGGRGTFSRVALPASLADLEIPQAITRHLDNEILEAFRDDASRCLAAIEKSILAYEKQPGSESLLRQICRELHTLKGASASVGLHELAEYLHQIEECLQSASSCEGVCDIESLLKAVDVIQRCVENCHARGGNESPGAVAGEDASAASDGSPSLRRQLEQMSDGGDSLRVSATQLDRLMDMLAELVMLRNRRESRVCELQKLNDELVRCVTRLRVEGEQGGQRLSTGGPHPLREIATDLLETARSQRDLYESITDENLTLSRFIRSFRHELTALRRLPLSGLFHRLQRAVRDAARVEGKLVRLESIGEHAGLERSLQERLHEPLLHLVRNAVGHGIEPESERRASAKPAEGTITLKARGGSSLLILEVRDDGRGLDYDAIRRRGIDRGLIAADHLASREELAQLIFHPGFSTREGANEVAGRGVGMDVVAETVNRMGGWIEIASTPGKGTRVQLSIPLRSVIEHAMVFRCHGQLYAVPMQDIHGAGDASEQPVEGEAELPVFHFAELFGGTSASDAASRQRLILGHGLQAAQPHQPRRCVLTVDEIVGPEEVVVRPLPSLLRHQQLFSGVTLAGSGEVLLLFDPQRLVTFSLARRSSSHVAEDSGRATGGIRKRILVVDDSISARRCLLRILHHYGLETVEAGDGREALQRMQTEQFVAVFTDLEMPGMSGLDLLESLPLSTTDPHPPVAVVSSRDEPEFAARALELGSVAYLTKPVAEAKVLKLLDQLGLVQAPRSEGESK